MQLTEDVLWDYADGLLPDAEKTLVWEQLRSQPELQSRLDAIMGEKKAFFNLPLQQPADGFAQQVMTVWATEQQAARAPVPAQAIGQDRKDWVLRGFVASLFLVFIVPISLVFAKMEFQPIRLDLFQKMERPMWWQQFDFVEAMRHPALHYAFYMVLVYMLLRTFDKYLQIQGFGLKEA